MHNNLKNSIDLSSFPNIFRFSEDINKNRNILNVFNDKTDIFQKKEILDINSIETKKILPNRFDCVVNNVTLSCLAFTPNHTNNKLYISLSSGIPTSIDTPLFTRWKYHNYFNGIYICIADPMLQINRKLPLNEPTWYYGYQDKDIFKSIKLLIEKISHIYNIDSKNITILGSSSGGFAAMYLGCILNNINVIALSPQLAPKLWSTSSNFENINKCNLHDSQNNKNDVSQLLQATNTTFFIVFNDVSKKDVQQINLLTDVKNIPYGISKYSKNTFFWKHSTHGLNPHNCNPEKYGMIILDWLLQEHRKGNDINYFSKFSILLSEMLAEKHFILRKNAKKCSKFNFMECLFRRLIF